MCEYCHTLPHAPGCHNAPEPRAIYKCPDCESWIYEGDSYVEIGDKYYHTECIDNMSVWEVLELIGIKADVA